MADLHFTDDVLTKTKGKVIVLTGEYHEVPRRHPTIVIPH